MSNTTVIAKEETFRRTVVTWKFMSDWMTANKKHFSDYFTLPSPYAHVKIQMSTGLGGLTFIETEADVSLPEDVDIKLIFVAGDRKLSAKVGNGSRKVSAHTADHFGPNGFESTDWKDDSIAPKNNVYDRTDYGYTLLCVMTVNDKAVETPSANPLSGAFETLYKTEDQTVDWNTTTDGLARALAKLFRDQTFSDAVLKVQGKTIKVTRAILAARSPVFCKMFETKPSELTIKDVDYESLMVLIGFIYTDRADASKLTLDVLVAAGKYNVPGLIALAENHVAKNLSVENIEQVLITAKRHNLTQFLNRCMQFVVSNDLGAEMTMKLLDRLA